MTIEAHTFPSNPQFNCALVTLCDAPTFTKLCVPGTLAFINGICSFAVERQTWSGVKNLFD